MQKRKNNRAEIFLFFDSLKEIKSYISARNEKLLKEKSYCSTL